MEESLTLKKSKLEISRIEDQVGNCIQQLKQFINEKEKENSVLRNQILILRDKLEKKNYLDKKLSKIPLTLKDIDTNLYGIGLRKLLMDFKDLKSEIFSYLNHSERRMMEYIIFPEKKKGKKICSICLLPPLKGRLKKETCVICDRIVCVPATYAASTKCSRIAMICGTIPPALRGKMGVFCRNCDTRDSYDNNLVDILRKKRKEENQ